MIVKRTIQKTTAVQLIYKGALLLIIGTLIIFLDSFSGYAGALFYTLGFFIYALGCGLVFSLAVAEAVRNFRELAGMANAMVGFTQMLMGSLATIIVSVLTKFTIQAFPVTMFSMALLSMLVIILFKKKIQ